ncbi:MAG TPA: hypothetical protein VGL97_17730 [Bryobacteraceae bacterium]|jgi:hypothetical protein
MMALLLWAIPVAAYAQETTLPEGTPIKLRLMRTLSSASANEGDKVDFQTVDDIAVAGSTLIPKGSTAIATITSAEPKKRMARGGKLSLNIDYVRLPDNEKLSLRGVQNVKGGGHTGAMTGGIVVTAIVLWPAAPFFLFMHGKDVSIPEGHEVTVYTSSDYQPKHTAAPSVAIARASSTAVAPIANADILKLKAAGFGDDLIVQRIRMSRGDYKLDPDALSDLKKAGLSDAVISAMMTAATQP